MFQNKKQRDYKSRSLKWACIVVFLLVIVSERSFLADALLCLKDTVLNSNAHEVVSNKVYRSAQMDAQQITNFIKLHSIRTVLDLRLGDDQNKEGPSEYEVVTNLGATYKHVSLRSTRYPSRDKMLELLTAFDEAETPLLLHCSNGAIRSAVASFIWLVEKERAPIDMALRQLSPRFGYFQIERTYQHWKMGHDLIDDLVYRFIHDFQESAINLRDWIRKLPVEDESSL